MAATRSASSKFEDSCTKAIIVHNIHVVGLVAVDLLQKLARFSRVVTLLHEQTNVSLRVLKLLGEEYHSLHHKVAALDLAAEGGEVITPGDVAFH